MIKGWKHYFNDVITSCWSTTIYKLCICSACHCHEKTNCNTFILQKHFAGGCQHSQQSVVRISGEASQASEVVIFMVKTYWSERIQNTVYKRKRFSRQGSNEIKHEFPSTSSKGNSSSWSSLLRQWYVSWAQFGHWEEFTWAWSFP